jgi:hypothetical protein
MRVGDPALNRARPQSSRAVRDRRARIPPDARDLMKKPHVRPQSRTQTRVPFNTPELQQQGYLQ